MMASPVIEGTSSGTDSGTSWTATLPSSIAVGDRLFIFLSMDGVGETATATGWDQVGQIMHLDTGFILTRIADGTEGSTVSVTISSSEAGSWACYRVSGADPDVIQYLANYVEGIADPAATPAITAFWGSDDNLFICFAAIRGDQDADGYPTGYSSGQVIVAGGGASAPGLALAGKAATAASDSPDGFSLTASAYSAAFTIVLRPPPAGGGGTSRSIVIGS